MCFTENLVFPVPECIYFSVLLSARLIIMQIPLSNMSISENQKMDVKLQFLLYRSLSDLHSVSQGDLQHTSVPLVMTAFFRSIDSLVSINAQMTWQAGKELQHLPHLPLHFHPQCLKTSFFNETNSNTKQRWHVQKIYIYPVHSVLNDTCDVSKLRCQLAMKPNNTF